MILRGVLASAGGVLALVVSSVALGAPVASWPDVTVTCTHGARAVVAKPTKALEPFNDWRVATADCGNDIVARFYWHPGQGQIRVALEYQPPSLFEKAEPRAYGAVIALDGVEVARHSIEAHLRYRRWSWRLKEPAVTRTAAELVAAKLIYPFAPVARHNEHIGEVKGTYRPLDSAGFIKYMRGPGGRQDFGPVTEAQGCYLATQDPHCRTVMFDQADSSGSWMWNARDPATGAPLRFDGEHIKTSFSDARFGDKVIITNFTRNFADGKTEKWVWDLAHLPAFSYVPFLLTGDPYYLESLQFEMVYVAGVSTNIGNRIFPRAVHTLEPRATSWAIRHVIHAALATPDAVPSWLVPGDYYRWLSRGNAKWMKAVWIDGDHTMVAFGKAFSAAYNTWSGSMERATDKIKLKRWQNDYTALAVGLAGLAGLEEWQPVIDWQMQAAVNCVRWLRGICAVYQLSANRDDGTLADGWPAFALKYADRIAENTRRAGDGGDRDAFDDFWQSLHAVISVAARLGYPDAAAMEAWLNGQAQNARGFQGQYKYSLRFDQPSAEADDRQVNLGLPLSRFVPRPGILPPEQPGRPQLP